MIALLGAIFSTTACSDWLYVSPETEKKKDEMFSKESGYRSALIGAYIRLKSTSLYGGEMTHGTVEMLAQHWNNTSKGSKEYLLSLFDYRNSTVESSFSSIYNNLYKVIADVNAVLEDIDANKDIFKENNYELIKAEALALRAYCHFDILRLFGPMPSNVPADAILPYEDFIRANYIGRRTADCIVIESQVGFFRVCNEYNTDIILLSQLFKVFHK